MWRHEKEQALGADFRLANRLVGTYDAVIVEDLAVSAMLKAKLWFKKLSEQRWAAFNKVLALREKHSYL